MKENKKNLPEKALIGMIHLRSLPGTPGNALNMNEIAEIALQEAELLSDAGFDALLLENMHDVPYLNREVGAEITAAMSVLAYQVKSAVNLPVGIQILAGANKSALAAALAAGLDFIRAEGFIFSHIADEGMMNSDAGELLRYRRLIKAENIAVFCDIKKKHASHSITVDTGIAETARAAEFFLADGVIVTGSSTGMEIKSSELIAVKESVNIKVLAGSGITVENLEHYWQFADGFIIGSYLKKNGLWLNGLDRIRCRKIVKKAESLK